MLPPALEILFRSYNKWDQSMCVDMGIGLSYTKQKWKS